MDRKAETHKWTPKKQAKHENIHNLWYILPQEMKYKSEQEKKVRQETKNNSIVQMKSGKWKNISIVDNEQKAEK